jgi:lysine-N-methylase
MTSSSTDIIRPNYMEKFRCIGGACEDSCCAGWRVVFDKRTAQTYLNAKDPEIREIATKSIKKIKTDRSSQNHSFIQMNPQTGACPFLQADKLCMVQGKMGEKSLSTVCATYPRHAGSVSGRSVEVATLSCPEAARLCLLDPEAMKVGKEKLSSVSRPSFSAGSQQLNAIHYLHQTALEMLEDPRLSFTEFVLVYGSALKTLDKHPDTAFTEDRRFSEMQGVIALVQTSVKDTQVASLQSKAAIQFQLGKVLPILTRHARHGLQNTRFQQSFLKAMSGILPDPQDLDNSVRIYQKILNGLSALDRKLIQTALRNYLLNDLVNNSSLYTRSADHALQCLQAVILRLSIFVIQLIGALQIAENSVIDELLTLIVSSTARAFEHNSKLILDMTTYLDKIEEKSVAVLALITPQLEK